MLKFHMFCPVLCLQSYAKFMALTAVNSTQLEGSIRPYYTIRTLALLGFGDMLGIIVPAYNLAYINVGFIMRK